MEILTLYVGQGGLAVIRHGTESILVDSRIPDTDEVSAESVEKKIETMTDGRHVVGLVLTSFDADHADPFGLDLLLDRFEPDWVMYPKYYKDTDNASAVFRVIRKHEARRENTDRPLIRHSVRLDQLDSRHLEGLCTEFQLELFSPHVEDMNNSNNCGIVLRVSAEETGGFSYLITGDTENDRWDRINALFGDALSSLVMAAPHHGSKNGANPETLLLVSPDTVLISAGVDNQYGHPDPQAVKMYQAVAEHVFATNVEGGVSLVTLKRGDDIVTELAR